MAQPTLVETIGDSSAARIMTFLRAVGRFSSSDKWFIDLMRGNGAKAQPMAKRDALADSLTQLAIDWSRRGAVQDNDSLDGVVVVATFSIIGGSEYVGGTPYPGALERLIRIHRESAGVLRHVVLKALLDPAVGRERALAYLRSVAESDDASAASAVQALITDAEPGLRPSNSPVMRAASTEILRQLFSARTVKNESARSMLAGFAGRRGWRPD